MDSWQTLVQGITVILLLTSFVKIATALSIFRFGLGLDGAVFGAVVFALSIALTFPAMLPEIERAGGLENFLAGTSEDGSSLEARFRPFLEKHADKVLQERFRGIADKLRARDGSTDAAAMPAELPSDAAVSPEVPFPVLIAAFLVSELRVALMLGLLFIVPFFLIDLLVAVALGALDLQNVSQQLVAVPLKLLLFFVIDGWALVTTKLLTYGQ